MISMSDSFTSLVSNPYYLERGRKPKSRSRWNNNGLLVTHITSRGDGNLNL